MASLMASSSGLHEYFDSPTHSDYFRALFEDGPLQGQERSSITLYGADDSDKFRSVIAWMYGLHFDGCSNHLRVKPDIPDGSDGYEYVRYSIEIYITAGEYGVVGLQESIAADLRKDLAILSDTNGFSPHVDLIARMVYLERPEAKRPLRPQVIEAAAASFQKIEDPSDFEHFKRLVMVVPALGWDLLMKVARELKGSRMVAGQDGGAA